MGSHLYWKQFSVLLMGVLEVRVYGIAFFWGGLELVWFRIVVLIDSNYFVWIGFLLESFVIYQSRSLL